jgi:hypothetical protein
LAIAIASPAAAQKGHLTDPSGNLPDIKRLDYNNAKKKVVVKMTYADLSVVQNHSFYLQWGKPKKYQVFYSPAQNVKELRFYRTASQFGTVRCAGLKVVDRPRLNTTTATIPRKCISKAPDTLRFKGVATLGLSMSDSTKLSKKVKRG